MWKNAQVIINNYNIYIYKRPGFAITDTFGATIEILDAPLLDISATQIRSLVREGKSIRYMVPDTVLEEIQKGGYYRK